MDGKRGIIAPRIMGLTRKQIKEIANRATMKSDKYIKIGRIGKMEVRISVDVEKVDNGFILHKEIYGIKMTTKMSNTGQEVYVTFPEVRARMIELLQGVADELAEAIPEKK